MIKLVNVAVYMLGYIFSGIGVYYLMTWSKTTRVAATIVAISWVLISIYFRVIEDKTMLYILGN